MEYWQGNLYRLWRLIIYIIIPNVIYKIGELTDEESGRTF